MVSAVCELHLDLAAMPVCSDPTDEIRAILILYAAGDVGPSGADATIMAILVRRGHASKRRIHPMKVGIHHLNRGGVIGGKLGGGEAHG